MISTDLTENGMKLFEKEEKEKVWNGHQLVTLKSESEAISSSSSLVADEAEMRVCCWLEVTRWGLLISP